MRLRLSALVYLCLVVPMFAQYELRKKPDGVLLTSQVKGRTYTLDLPGKKVVPYGLGQADHPYLTVNGAFLQVLSVPIAEFKADASASDESVLKQQMKYEAEYWKIPLSDIDSHSRKIPGGRTALVWSYMPTFGPRPVRQVFLTFRSGSYVVVLGSSVERSYTKSAIESFLLRIASSFRPTR